MQTRVPAFLLLLLLVAFDAMAARLAPGERNLKDVWLVLNGEGRFVSYDSAGNSPEVIYLRLNARELKGRTIQIRDIRPFNLFINNSLAGAGDFFLLKPDSLAITFSSSDLLVAIHRDDRRFTNLTTTLAGQENKDILTEGLVKREGSYFRDFGIVGFVLLLGAVVLVIRLNPKLASDYFSFTGIFSSRDIQDSQVSTRIGSSTNVLFYLYCSMLLAYYLMIAFHFTSEEFPLANVFKASNFWSVVFQWLKLSLYLLAFFFLKIIVIFGVSYLFGLPEIAGIHFFNWIRLLLIIFGVLTIILFVYFIWHGHNADVHATMLKLLGWTMGGWILLIFLKLSRNASASPFHLFSYICATELIPFLFIVKVLYK